MSHFAKVLNGNVVQVIVAEKEFFNTFIDNSPGEWIQTSYNTKGGIHYGQDGNPDSGVALRGNYAGVGFVYDSTHDVFYPPQLYPSWTISAPNWTWTPPTPMPSNGLYKWDELNKNWLEIKE